MTNVEYAVTGDGTHIAYRVYEPDPACDTPRDVVLVTGGFIPLEIIDDETGLARLLDGLRGIGRVLVFDRRGVGQSDPVTDWEKPILEQWSDDLAAVIDATGAHDVLLVGFEGYGVASRYAALHPENVSHYVVFDPVLVPDDQWEQFKVERLEQIEANMRGERDLLDVMAPSRANDPSFRAWYERAGRTGASPASAQRTWESIMRSQPSEQLLDKVTVSTLLLHRRGNALVPPDLVEQARVLMPTATIVELDGADAFPFAGDVDSLLAEIANFVVGEHRLPPPQRLLAAVLFSDLVGSTEHAASVGDAQWKAVLDRHDAAVRAAVGRCGGSVIKTTGDGVLALFPSAAGALQAADRLRTLVAADQLQVRVGIHVGDIDRRGDDVSGLAVNIAARVMSRAGDGNVAATASVVAAMAGQPVGFEPMGAHELKGVPGVWELFRVAGST